MITTNSAMFCSFRLISFLTGGRCREALGMENGKIADDQITASSEGEAYRAVNGRLHYISLHKEDHSVGNLKAQAASVKGCKLTFFLTITQ